MTTSTLAKQTRVTLEAAKSDIDLALRQCKTSRALRQRRLCAAAQAGRVYAYAVEGGMNLPGHECLAIISTQRPLTDEDALGVWHCCAAAGVRGKYPARLNGRSGRHDFAREIRNKAGEVLGRNGKPLKVVKTKHKGPDGKTYPGARLSGEPATERDNMDEPTLLEVEQQIAVDWSNLFALLIEALDEPKKRRATTRRCSKRDAQFVTWSQEGLDGYAIAAKWNKLHPTDNVSNEAVKKAIQRGRDK